jgi:hypothetical protein
MSIFFCDCNGGGSGAAVVDATAAVLLAMQGETKNKNLAALSVIAEFSPLSAADAATTAAALHCDLHDQ